MAKYENVDIFQDDIDFSQDDFSVGVTHFSQDNILGNGPGDAPQNLNPRNIVNKYIAPSLKKKNKFRNKIERKKLKKKFSKINTIQPVADIASASAIPILENSIHINVRNKMKEIKKQKLNWKKQDNNAPAGNPGIPPNMTNVQAGNPGMQPNMANVQAGNPGMLPNMINVQAGNPGMPPNMANVQTGNPGMPPNMINFQAGNPVMQPNMAAATGPASGLGYKGPKEPVEETESSEGNQNNQKRLSAFHRLGPVSQPKKPKLTINLNLNKDQPVREVVDETNDDPEKYTPTHLRKNIIASTDETVMKYLPFWPWKKNFGIRKSVTARNSKIKGYPSSWTKEQVLDAVLDCVKEYSLIPCFVEVIFYISHFLYFPLNRLSNQKEFVQVDTVIEWSKLTALDISHNRLKDISGFDLQNVTPNLKHLNLSHNYLDKIISLINCRSLPLKSIHLEGNPLCLDYIDPEHYIKVLRLLFPAITEIDGVPIQRSGEMPQFKRNYCPDEAKAVTEKFLEIYFPLLDAGPEHRSLIQGIQTYRLFRNLFLYARFLDEGEIDSVTGAMAITKLVNRWPKIEHDPHSFSVDVMSHTPSTTILRVSGMLKLIAETEDDDEHLLAFTRTVVLHSEDGDEYKIHNEMVYWDEPTAASARSAFRVSSTEIMEVFVYEVQKIYLSVALSQGKLYYTVHYIN
ncbi:hypothetical protein HF086_006648 [Spodoptera exigua]|uniref:NTF2 domain-containing protein n=1 Tax=Spodoptera exigua TaxID=7107 RepID=A0A922M819_SPOEX|nr:hypothetical protein HF086_006648 [Spodoptera exigua]